MHSTPFTSSEFLLDRALTQLPVGVSRKLRNRFLRANLDRRHIVGQVIGADGSTPATGRQSRTGGAVVSAEQGKYYELASRGLTFAACDQGSGVSTQTTISTTCILSLYNPANSAKVLQLLKRSVQYFSGTLGAGTIYDCVLANATQAAPSGGTLLTSQCTGLGQISGAASVGVCRVGSTVAAPTAVWPIMYSGTFAGATSVPSNEGVEDMDGWLVIHPGCSYQIQSVIGAGTSPKVTVAVLWAEVALATTQG